MDGRQGRPRRRRGRGPRYHRRERTSSPSSSAEQPLGDSSGTTDRSILAKQPSVEGAAQWFTGDVHFDVIAPGTPLTASRGRVNVVRFAPGARTAWHRHANGQTLHVTEGLGLTQVRGGDVVAIRPGDTVWCPPQVWHWHGAAAEHFMTHLAIWDSLAEGQDGPETEWGEHVSDVEYGQQPT